MLTRHLTLALIISLGGTAARADWAFMSQHAQLEGNAIAYVGEVSQQTKIVPDTFENLEWYEFKHQGMTQFCFTFSGLPGLWGFGEKPALLVVDKHEDVRLAILESSIGNIKVEIYSISRITCPSPY